MLDAMRAIGTMVERIPIIRSNVPGGRLPEQPASIQRMHTEDTGVKLAQFNYDRYLSNIRIRYHSVPKYSDSRYHPIISPMMATLERKRMQ